MPQTATTGQAWGQLTLSIQLRLESVLDRKQAKLDARRRAEILETQRPKSMAAPPIRVPSTRLTLRHRLAPLVLGRAARRRNLPGRRRAWRARPQRLPTVASAPSQETLSLSLCLSVSLSLSLFLSVSLSRSRARIQVIVSWLASELLERPM